MLHWRLILGTVIIAGLAGLCWLDDAASLPGAWLMPLAIVFVTLATAELLQLVRAAGMLPKAWAVYAGNVLVVVAGWLPIVLAKWSYWELPTAGPLSRQDAVSLLAWPAAAISLCALVVFVREMCAFKKPGGAIASIASSLFILVYLGLLFGFLVQLRFSWGVRVLASLIIAVKLGDTGAYLAGSLFGRRKMAPTLSPGKTVEGALGAVLFACLGAWLSWHFLLPSMSAEGVSPVRYWSWIPYGILLGMAGVVGDLAESLIKRDADRKDSSTWFPGFGGVLDLLDSLLFAAPVGWLFWICFVG